MEKYRIIVKGDDYSTDKQRTTSISLEDLKYFKPLIKAIIKKRKEPGKNWTTETELVKDNKSSSGWTEVQKVYDIYPEFDKEIVRKFFRYVPIGRLYKIYEIEIIKVEEINIDDI